MEKEQKFVIIDSNALVHRAFHAIPELTTKKGVQINAVYGFFLVLIKLIKELKPDYLVATFDLAGPTFRHKQYKEYKAKRVKAPDSLYEQIPIIKDFLRALEVPIYEKQGFEADDVIGTISKKIPGKQSDPRIKTIILTGDLDTLQLIDDQTEVYTFKKGIRDTTTYNAERVIERFTIEPDQLVDYRALKGDPSDNIPGVLGIGDKTASQLIKQFGTLENLYSEIESNAPSSASIRERVRKLLIDNKDQAFFSKTLSTIRLDVPVDLDLKDCKWNGFTDGFESILTEYDFSKILSDIQNNSEKKEVSLLDQIEKLYKDKVFSKKIYEIEKNLFSIVDKMNKQGIKVDINKLKKLNNWFGKKIKETSEEIFKLVGEDFNLNSPSQVSDVLFNKLKINKARVRKTSKKRELSTAFSELEKIKNEHEIIPLLLRFRELNKIKSAVIENLLRMIGEDGRIHPQFNQLGAVSGRFSCSHPNLQNIPKKGRLADSIRKCFLADEKYNLVSFDYSQMELRVSAFLSDDKKMKSFFEEQKDVHKMTAALIFEKKEEDVSEKERNIGKTLNFAVIYGMGPFGFSEATKFSVEESTVFIALFYQQFLGIREFKDKILKGLMENHLTETFFGRKRFFPELATPSVNFKEKERITRMAFNHVIQGTSADIIKMAMIKLEPLISDDVKLVSQIHDELVFEIKETKENNILKIKEIMESAFDMMVVDVKKGPNLGELKNIKI